MLALNLVRTLTRRLHYPVEVILCGPGGLLSEFEAAAPVHQFWSPELSRDAKLAIIQRLYAQGARLAICNTSVVGECVEMLKSAGFAVVSLIHELPDLIEAHRLESSVQQIVRAADRLVFPAAFVRDRFLGMNEQVATRTVVQPQGVFAPNAFFSQRQFARSELRERLGLPPTARIILGSATRTIAKASTCSPKRARGWSGRAKMSCVSGSAIMKQRHSHGPRRSWSDPGMLTGSSFPD